MAKKLAFDRLLFGSVVLLVFTGLLMIYSASAMQIYLPTSAAPAGAYFFVIKQTVAVLVRAPINGARRWLSLGVIKSVQPSEFAKIGLVVALAALLSRREREITH